MILTEYFWPEKQCWTPCHIEVTYSPAMYLIKFLDPDSNNHITRAAFKNELRFLQ